MSDGSPGSLEINWQLQKIGGGGGGRRGQLLEHFLTDSGSDSSLMDPVIFSKTAVPPLTCFYHLQFLRPAFSPLGL